MAGNLPTTPTMDFSAQQSWADAARLPAVAEPGWFSGAASSAGGAIANLALGLPGLVAANIVTPIVRWGLDAAGLKDTEIDNWFKGEQTKAQDFSRSLRPNPTKTGMVGNLLYGAATTVVPAVAGFIGGGPAGSMALTAGVQALDQYNALVPELGPQTAAGPAAIRGASAAIGVALPGSFGLKFTYEAAAQAAINVASGMGERAATSAYLRSAGREDVAARYNWMDKHEMVADAVIGALVSGGIRLLGGGARPSTAQVDAAATVHGARMAQDGSAPGYPKTVNAIDSHVANIDKAVDDLLAGRPVEVNANLQDFEARPPSPMQQSIARALDEEGITPREPVVAETAQPEQVLPPKPAADGEAPKGPPTMHPELEQGQLELEAMSRAHPDATISVDGKETSVAAYTSELKAESEQALLFSDMTRAAALCAIGQ